MHRRHRKVASLLSVLAAAAALAAVAGVSGTTTASAPQAAASGASELPVGQQPVADPNAPLATSTFLVGPAEIAASPVHGGSDYDSMISGIALPNGRGVRVYAANQQTHLLTGPDVEHLKVVPDHIVLDRSSDTAPGGGTGAVDANASSPFDRCGAWLKAAYPDPARPGVIRGWYHAEHHCNYDYSPGVNQSRHSMAYAESYDGGRTFHKRGNRSKGSVWPSSTWWPNNQIATSPFFPTYESQIGQVTGVGEAAILERGDMYYMYFTHDIADGSTIVSLARSRIADGGLPGTWQNYLGVRDGVATWSATSLASDSAPLRAAKVKAKPECQVVGPLPAGCVVDGSLGRGASIQRATNAVVTADHDFKNGGVTLASSSDGIAFTRLPQPLTTQIPADQRGDWDNLAGDKWVYTTILAKDAGKVWDDTFYLFQVYIPDGASKDTRYLVRRKVRVVGSTDGGQHSYTALTGHTGTARTRAGVRHQDRWDTTGVAVAIDPKGRPTTYTTDAAWGYIATTQLAGTAALYDCETADGDRFASQKCDGATTLRTIGYVWTDRGAAPSGAVPLYRCVRGSARKRDNYVTTSTPKADKSCDGGGTLRWQAGYVLPPR